MWAHVNTYYGVVTPPFLTPKEPSCACADREVSLDLRSGHLISLLQQSSALPLALSLECLGENKASVLLHVTNTSCPAQVPIHLVQDNVQIVCMGESPPYGLQSCRRRKTGWFLGLITPVVSGQGAASFTGPFWKRGGWCLKRHQQGAG